MTYAESIAPILNRSCVRCHCDGGAAPFSLTSYDDAKKWIPMILQVTHDKYMPPWKAVAGYGDFLDANTLSDDELAALQKWSEDGTPRGDASKEPALSGKSSDWPLGTPDLVLKPSRAFSVKADGTDVYRSFLLPTNFRRDKWIKAVAIKPGAIKIVHHIIIFMDSSGVAVDMNKASSDGQIGFPDSGGAPGFIPSGILGTWAPGSTARLAPDGTAMLMRPKDQIVMQVHYHKDGKQEEDQTELGLYFAKEPIKKQLRLMWMMDVDLRIPAGDNHYVESYDEPVEQDMTVYTAYPHMHNLGQSEKAEVRFPDGTVKPLIWVDHWDFRWQITYALKEPMKIPKGSTIHVEATYDNSADNPLNPNSPPKRVKFGRQTKDEMLLLILGYTLDSEKLASN